MRKRTETHAKKEKSETLNLFCSLYRVKQKKKEQSCANNNEEENKIGVATFKMISFINEVHTSPPKKKKTHIQHNAKWNAKTPKTKKSVDLKKKKKLNITSR